MICLINKFVSYLFVLRSNCCWAENKIFLRLKADGKINFSSCDSLPALKVMFVILSLINLCFSQLKVVCLLLFLFLLF